MGYYSTTWGKGEIEEMLRRWHGILKNAKTPSERANAREQILKLQEVWRFHQTHKNDARRRARSRTGILGLNFSKSVRFG